jgi:DNA-binding LytR/AlgR family response regulator
MRVVIAEDEAVVARRIARLTADILGPGNSDLRFATNVPEARTALAADPPDLLILDLSLEGEEGFDLLRESTSCAFETIVISAHTDRALDAFDYGVRDFVPKPFTRERLERAMQRVIHASHSEHPVRYLGIRRDGETQFISIDDIVFIRGAGTRSELVLRDKRCVQHEKLLERLEAALPPHFERIHKSFIVDVRHVKRLEMREGSRYSVVLADGTRLPVGRTRVQSLRRRFA